MAKNGTNMYCPNCDKITQCKSIPLPEYEGKGWNERSPRYYYTEHKDISFYKRNRQCLSCGHEFYTAEGQQKYLDELINLRDKTKSQTDEIQRWRSYATGLSTNIDSLKAEIANLKLPKNSVEQSLTREVSQLQQTNDVLIAENQQLETTIQILEAKLAAIAGIATSTGS